jgi:hypothetical protein
MIAGAAAHHASPGFGGVEMGHLVVGTSQLEAEHGLLILTLEQDLTFKAVAQVDGVDQRNLVAHLSDPGV